MTLLKESLTILPVLITKALISNNFKERNNAPVQKLLDKRLSFVRVNGERR